MKRDEIKNKLATLKDIQPDAGFCSSSREKIISFISENPQPAKFIKQSSFSINWTYFFRSAVVLSAFVLVFSGYKGLVDINNSVDLVREEVSSIKNEWQLADVSPYLDEIFKEERKEQDVKKSVSVFGGLAQAVSSQNENNIKKSIGFNTIPNLGITDVDRGIESLTF